MLVTNKLDKNSTTPLYRQISDALTNEIADLPPSTKLPTIRNLAQSLGVNNATVVNAYKHLETKGAVYSVVGSGFYVAQQKHTTQTTIHDCINFADTNTDPAYFPVDAFRNAFDSVLLRDGGMAFSQGYEPLRQDIQIITSIGQAVEKIAENFITPGDVVFVERPGLQAITATFLARKARVIEVPRDANTLDKLEQLIKQNKPKLIFLMPNFQFPTGLSYTTPDKNHIINIVNKTNTYIIEADLLSDFYFDGEPRTSMKSLDTNDRVIYIKCFSRILAPGLEMGFLTLPKALSKNLSWNAPLPSGLMQRVFDFYLRHGGFAEHAAFMRSQYGKRYGKLIQACNTYLAPYASFTEPGGGLGIWVSPKTLDKNGEKHFEKFLNRQVVVSPGSMFSSAKSHASHFRINFANVSSDRIVEGIGIISSVLASC